MYNNIHKDKKAYYMDIDKMLEKVWDAEETEKIGVKGDRISYGKYDFSEDELAYYVDMADSWRESDIAERIETVRVSVATVTFITVVFGAYFLTKRIDGKKRT